MPEKKKKNEKKKKTPHQTLDYVRNKLAARRLCVRNSRAFEHVFATASRDARRSLAEREERGGEKKKRFKERNLRKHLKAFGDPRRGSMRIEQELLH